MLLMGLGLAQTACAADVTGRPLTQSELERLRNPPQLSEYGLTDSHIKFHDVWYRIGDYGLVFGARDVFVGIIQNIGEDNWRFIPYSGKKRFFHRNAVALTWLANDELAIWFRPDRTVETARITFSMTTNVFTDQDVIVIETSTGTFYPEYNFEASTADRLDFTGLWQHDPTQQWEYHRFLTYSELAEWDITAQGAVRLMFQMEHSRAPNRLTVQEALFDPQAAELVTVSNFSQ